MRKALGTLVAVAIAAAGVVGLIAFFDARDSATTGPVATAPTQVNAGELLAAGNIELAYADPSFGPKLTALARRLGAPDTPALRAAGAAIIVQRETGVAGVLARAYGQTYQARSPTDRGLQDFVDRWLGTGTSG